MAGSRRLVCRRSVPRARLDHPGLPVFEPENRAQPPRPECVDELGGIVPVAGARFASKPTRAFLWHSISGFASAIAFARDRDGVTRFARRQFGRKQIERGALLGREVFQAGLRPLLRRQA